MSVGIPIKLIHESLGHVLTVEVKTGETYRGKLVWAEDNMNLMLEGVVVTARDGKGTNAEQVYIRGSQIRFIIFPDMLRHAPMFKLLAAKGKGKPKTLGLAGQKRALAVRQKGFFGGRGRP